MNFGVYKFVWTSHFNWSHEWWGVHSLSTCSFMSSQQGMFKSKNIVVIWKSVQGHCATTNCYLNLAPKPLGHMLHLKYIYFLYPRWIHTLHHLYVGFENKHSSIIDQLNCNFYPTSNIQDLNSIFIHKIFNWKEIVPPSICINKCF